MMTRDDHQTNEPTEPTGDASPVGLCPYCDYQLVAVGVCPECGNTVNDNKLRARPRRTRLRRLIKRVLAVLLFTAVIWGGRALYLSNVWYQSLPTSWLTEMYPANAHAATVLGKRLDAAELSHAEIDALVAKSFSYAFDIRSPRPDDIDISMVIKQSQLKNSLFSATFITDSQQRFVECVVSLLIDGNRIGKGERICLRRMSGYLGITEEHDVTVILKPGFYTASVNWRAQVTRRQGNGNSIQKFPVAGKESGVDILIQKVFEREFQILDQGVCELLNCRFDNALADDIMKNLGICLVREDTFDYTHFIVDSSKFEGDPLIGQIHALTLTQAVMQVDLFVKGSDAFRNALWANSPRIPAEFRPRPRVPGNLFDVENRAMLFLRRVDSDTATVVFVPDPGLAFEAGRRECALPCILWRDMPFQELPLSGLDPISARPKLSYPDAVWNWDDDRDIADYFRGYRWRVAGDAEQFNRLIEALPNRVYD